MFVTGTFGLLDIAVFENGVYVTPLNTAKGMLATSLAICAFGTYQLGSLTRLLWDPPFLNLRFQSLFLEDPCFLSKD